MGARATAEVGINPNPIDATRRYARSLRVPAPADGVGGPEESGLLRVRRMPLFPHARCGGFLRAKPGMAPAPIRGMTPVGRERPRVRRSGRKGPIHPRGHPHEKSACRREDRRNSSMTPPGCGATGRQRGRLAARCESRLSLRAERHARCHGFPRGPFGAAVPPFQPDPPPRRRPGARLRAPAKVRRRSRSASRVKRQERKRADTAES